MLTSSREESDLVRSYELGVNAYVVKPVDFKEFFDAIQELGVFWARAERAAAAQGRLAIERGADAGASRTEPLRILHLEDSDLDAELIEAELDGARPSARRSSGSMTARALRRGGDAGPATT